MSQVQYMLVVGERIQPGDLVQELTSGRWLPVGGAFYGMIHLAGHPPVMRMVDCGCNNTKPGEDNTP